ncbi:TetR/AcrR family transcriptional regulator [Streptomyces sp. NRRL F-5126]|uniref:TetR/AcrR family transcriptional regulator n=1 Tax=Streptomyces sp. NRRL F-5126 TaxID=1463857 RepID=UPI0004CB523E|nr:TetR family transcriptional regulator [Streptomyces sp. NRRL F-5126]
MVNATRPSLTDRTAGTRAAIMETAERLFAEHGLSNVSSRGIAEAAGQRNVTAVSYHFGSRTELVRVIMERHGEQAELLRRRHLSLVEGSTGIRDWAGCLVRPATEHLASLGVPSWNARFSAQVMTDPTMRLMISEEAVARPYLARILGGLGACLEHLPRHVRVARGAMARNVLIHTCAERERALAEGSAPLHGSWDATADELTDAIVGLLSAPTTTSGTRGRSNRA